MLKAHLRLEGIKDGFDDEALAQHDLVSHGHQVVPHVPADTSNEVQAALPKCLEQVLTDIAFIGVELAGQVPGDLIQHGAVGGVAGGDFQGHDLALVVDHEVQLEAEKPPHAGLAARGQAIEDLVTVDAAIVTDGELGCSHEVDAGLLAAEAVQQHREGDKQPGHQADEPVIVRQLVTAGAILTADAVEVEHLEVLVGREVKQHHDEQHLGATACRSAGVSAPTGAAGALPNRPTLCRSHRDSSRALWYPPPLRRVSGTGLEAQSSQTDAVKSLIRWESPHPLSIAGVTFPPRFSPASAGLHRW